jgi:DNA-binding protein HU-beta
MNKSDLINALSEETAFSKADVARILDTLVRVVERSLANGEKVQWSGFGTFNVSKRPARKGINPSTKERIFLPETIVPKFKPAKNLRDQVRGEE